MSITKSDIEKYLNFCQYQKNLDGKTIKAYRIDLTQYQDQCDNLQTSDDLESVSVYIEHLHGSCKPRTIKRKIASLKAYYNYCADFEFISVNPFSRLKVRYSTPKVLPRTIPREDVWKILQTAHTEMQRSGKTEFQSKTVLRDVAVLELLFATGVRVSELCGSNRGNLHIPDQYLQVMGKGSKERIIQVTHPVVLGILQDYIAITTKDCAWDTPLFYTRNKGRISEGTVRRIINKYAALAGIFNHLTPHMFRHTFATLLLEEGVDIRYIQFMLGHSSITTTQIYTHVAIGKQKEIIATNHPRNKMAI